MVLSMEYRLFHLREAYFAGKAFLPLSVVGTVDLRHYHEVYASTLALPAGASSTDATMLEQLFYIFNMEHPANYHAHSMSVGDVVMLDDSRLYFCDQFGFAALDENNSRGSL